MTQRLTLADFNALAVNHPVEGTAGASTASDPRSSATTRIA